MPWKVLYLPQVHKFISKLSIKDRSRLKLSISFLENYGPDLRAPVSKKISKNLFELRIKGQNSYRIFYSRIKQIFILIHIFKKKSQKIPSREINTALDRLKQII